MHTFHRDFHSIKGWFTGPWDADIAVSVGYANVAIDEPHLHTRITEIYLVGAGVAEMRVEGEDLHLEAGDVVIIEPGEAHTFLSSSPDYFHFVVHTPGMAGEEALKEKVLVERERAVNGVGKPPAKKGE